MKLSNPVKTKLTTEILAAADVVCKAGQYTEFGRWKGQVGLALFMGFGAYEKLNEAIGRIFMNIKDAGGEINGLVRIERHDPQDNFLDKVFEDRTESLRQSTTYSEQLSFSFNKDSGVGRDSYFVFMFKPDLDKTVDVSACIVNIDCTQFKVAYNY